MANLVYLTLNGQLQGLISAGCSSLASIGNKAQVLKWSTKTGHRFRVFPVSTFRFVWW
jgi:type VI secretion system Hcp family effector